MMDRQLFRQVIQTLVPHVGSDGARSMIVQAAWRDAPNLQGMVNYSGAPQIFASNLVSTAERYGTIQGRSAVLYLLDEVEGMVGEKQAADIKALKAALGDPGEKPAAATKPTQSGGGSQTTNMGDINAQGGTVNIGGTINIYGNAPGVPNPPAPSTSTPQASPTTGGGLTRDQVFISYSHKETEWLNELMTSLRPRMRKGAVSVWTDEAIAPGSRWRDEINNALASARVAVLMVSRNFFASSFISEKELPVIMEAAKRGDLTLLWVPVTYSSVTETEVAEYQTAGSPLLSPSNTLDSLEPAQLNRALETVAKQIVDAYNAYDETS